MPESVRNSLYVQQSDGINEADCQGPLDLKEDVTAGFDLISTWDLDEQGVDWIARKIKARVGNRPVVISLDGDVLDPSHVPASKFAIGYHILTS